ncbi:MAG: tetratricopeptide repeat protein [Pseudomonadota bacterium]|mgnify:CR=1 FL=1
MKPHAFVAMPFGIKKNREGNELNFNRIYEELIKPALEAANLEPFRADEEIRAGNIITDMFQELLIADLVVADITIDNPNVWYELGVRHALRARGTVLINGGQLTNAFDIQPDRKLRYSIKDGGPDPATLEQDKKTLTDMVVSTMESWHERKISPIYHALPNLQEPDWKSLRIGDVREFWDQHEAWQQRIDSARKSSQIGNLLVLAEEAPIAAFRAEAWIEAGVTLRKAKRFNFAIEQLQRGLAIDPDNLRGLREMGICLQRLALQGESTYSLDDARAHYHKILDKQNSKFNSDSETWSLLGRVDKDAWIASWYQDNKSTEQWRQEAAYEEALLRAAIENYAIGYRHNQSHFYSGINALTLMHLYHHLTNDFRYDREIAILSGAVRYAAEYATNPTELFWSKATLGDIEVLAGTPDSIKTAYQEAIVHSNKDWFALDSCRDQLILLKNLGFHPENVEMGIATFDRAMQKLNKPDDHWKPKKVFLFSGHMMDAPDRPILRFPAEKVSAAAQKIANALHQLNAGPEDLALTQGANGGDLLFTEACQQLGIKVQWLQPFDEPQFIEKSVINPNEIWRERYRSAKEKLTHGIRSAPGQLGPAPKGIDPYVRCNLWLLYTALSHGIRKVHFICLWNGSGGDGVGGTAHMYQEVKERTGNVTWIDTREL